MSLLSIRGVALGFGGPKLLEDVNLQIEPGERVCLVGRNGAGKSTLIRMITGEVIPDAGIIEFRQGARASRLPQEVPADLSGTIFDVVRAGAGGEAAGTDESWEIDQRVETLLSRMNLAPEADVRTLSAGLKRRTLLARALADAPDLLLLDEPTNHLDIASIEWLEDFLSRHVKTILFVSHDRAFLRGLATRIVEIDRGRLTSWACGYDEYVERKEARLEVERNQREQFEKKLASEETWLRQGIKARRTRNEGRVRALLKMRDERRAWRERLGNVRMQAQEASRTGKLVIEAENLSFGYEGRTIVRNFSTTVIRGDRIGIIGPNGTGKTTLLNLLLGQLPPDAGAVRHGTRLEIAYFDQLRMQLDEDKTVADNVGDGTDKVIVNGKPRHIIGYLKDFLFTPDRAKSQVSMLSGGERNRLLLAKLFTKPSNVLVLDEPTNDLDYETLELLEELLDAYTGTVLLVSHDRAFLNNVVSATYAFEGDGVITEYAGGYDDYLRQRPEPVEETPDKPKSKAQKPKKERPRKLTFKEQKELKALPNRIEKLETEQAEIHGKMSDPAFYRRDGAEIAAVKERLEALGAELSAAYARWEELEDIVANS